MSRPFFKTVELTDQFVALAQGRTVLNVTISAPPTNVAAVTLRDPEGREVDLVPGEWHELKSIDLAGIDAKGQAGDELTLVGGD